MARKISYSQAIVHRIYLSFRTRFGDELTIDLPRCKFRVVDPVPEREGARNRRSRCRGSLLSNLLEHHRNGHALINGSREFPALFAAHASARWNS